FIRFRGTRQDENANPRGVQLRVERLEALFRLLVPRRRLQQGEEHKPVPGGDGGVDMLCAEAGATIERQQMAEARVVVEIQAEARRVHEDELTRRLDLELSFGGDDLPAQRRELLERALDRGVLHRIELDGAKRRVISVNQAAPCTPDVRIAGVRVSAGRR